MESTSKQPVIRRALGASWERLHATVRRHYDLPRGAIRELTLHGCMDHVDHAAVAKPMLLIGRLFGALVIHRGRDIEVSVTNRGDANSLHWHRRFFFPGRRPLVFRSCMQHLSADEIVEFVRFGLGICMRLAETEGRLRYTSNGYLWQLGVIKLRIPDWLLLGRAVIEEYGIDDETIGLRFDIRHPLWGHTFTYHGRFTLPVEPVR